MKSLINFINEQIITEHFVNLWEEDEMKKYAKEVWDILEFSYKAIGGMAGVSSVDELIADSKLWKMVRRNGKIVAVCCYKKPKKNNDNTRKLFYLGSDGTKEGVEGVKQILKEDFNLTDREAWVEASGGVAITAIRQGAYPIPSYLAKQIMSKKEFIPFTDEEKKLYFNGDADKDNWGGDGYNYKRLIGGQEHTKVLFVSPKTKEQQACLSDEFINSFIDTLKRIGNAEKSKH